MLAQLLVALPLAAISIFGMSIFLNKAVRQSIRVETQISLDVIHAQAINEVQGFKALTDHTNLGAILAQQALKDCVVGRGTGCGQYNQIVSIQNLNAQGTFNTQKDARGAPCSGNTCVFRQDAQAQWICTNTRCNDLEITLRTTDLREDSPRPEDRIKTRHRIRTTKILLPARALMSRGNIDFNCTNNSMLMEINYENSMAVCFDITGYNATTNEVPARSVTGAAVSDINNTPGSQNCGMGFKKAGLFRGVHDCYTGQGAYTPSYLTPPSPPSCPSGQVMNGSGSCVCSNPAMVIGPGGTCIPLGCTTPGYTLGADGVCHPECPYPGGVKQPSGICFYANRWCPLSGVGFAWFEQGGLHERGCYDVYTGNFYQPGQIFYGHTRGPSICRSGPASLYPLPADFCEVSNFASYDTPVADQPAGGGTTGPGYEPGQGNGAEGSNAGDAGRSDGSGPSGNGPGGDASDDGGS